MPVDSGIQCAEAEAAVGLERVHAQLFGQGESLAVMGCGLCSLRRLPICRNVAEEAQGIRLVAAFLVLTSKRQRTFGKGMSLLLCEFARKKENPSLERYITSPYILLVL